MRTISSYADERRNLLKYFVTVRIVQKPELDEEEDGPCDFFVRGPGGERPSGAGGWGRPRACNHAVCVGLCVYAVCGGCEDGVIQKSEVQAQEDGRSGLFTH